MIRARDGLLVESPRADWVADIRKRREAGADEPATLLADEPDAAHDDVLLRLLPTSRRLALASAGGQAHTVELDAI